MTTLSEQAQFFAEMQEYLIDGSVELFASYGLKVSLARERGLDCQGRNVMAVIGYAAEKMRGALLVVAAADVIEALHPTVQPGVNHDEALRDALGEFANMMIGRLKNKLIRHDVNAFLATPTTVAGDNLHLPVPRSGLSAWHCVEGERGTVFLRFDVTFDPDFVLGPPIDARGSPIEEGEMMLF